MHVVFSAWSISRSASSRTGRFSKPSNRRRALVALAGGSLAAALLTAPFATGPASAVSDALPAPVTVLDDFSAALPAGQPLTYAGDGYAYSFTETPATPSSGSGGVALKLGTSTSTFAGMVRQFVDGAGAWQPVDASAAEGFGFSFYGSGSGTSMFVDVLDNRAPGSTSDTAGRWTVNFVDDVAGWRELFWTWDEFAFKFVGNGAPDDGFTLEEINGWGVGSLGTGGMERQFYLDDAAIAGERPLTVAFEPPVTYVNEGETAQIPIRLSRTSEDDLTFSWATSRSTDRTSTEDVVASPGRDYVENSGIATISAGDRDAVLTVETVQNETWEVDESFQVLLTDTDGLPDGPATRGVVSIIDDDPRDARLIEDGAEPGLLSSTKNAKVEVIEVAADEPRALPGQQYIEDVVRVRGNGKVVRNFARGQDWSAAKKLSLLHKGSKRKSQTTVTILDGNGSLPPPEDWELIWRDEFNGPAGSPANPKKWNYETGGWGWGNQELQYYADGARFASLDGYGNLVIRTDEVEDPAAAGLPCWYGDCEYTSARLNTEGKAEFAYGRISARLKAPAGQGIWPAFWSLGNDFRDVTWPQTGEIDFYEFVGREPNEVFGTIHGPGYSGGDSFNGTITTAEPVPEAFHDIEVVWQPNLIEWYFDGVKYHQATPEDVAPNPWPFDKPFNLLLNTALGGNFGGTLGEDLELPGEYLVDHVRVYGAPDTAQRWRAKFRDTASWQRVNLKWSDFKRAKKQPEGAATTELRLTDVQGWRIESPGGKRFLVDDLHLKGRR